MQKKKKNIAKSFKWRSTCVLRSAKRKGRKEKKKKEEGELWNVLEFGGMARKKKEERRKKIRRSWVLQTKY